jgi:hypothetical protein
MYAMRYRHIRDPNMSSIAVKDHTSIVRRPQLSQNVCNKATDMARVAVPCIHGNIVFTASLQESGYACKDLCQTQAHDQG